MLEAVASAFGSPELARPPVPGTREQHVQFEALIVLDGTEADDDLLAALLQRHHVPPLFPAARDELRPCRLGWCGTTRKPTFTLGRAAGFDSLVDVRERLRDRGSTLNDRAS